MAKSKQDDTKVKPSDYSCPVTEAEFLEHAGPITGEIGGTKFILQPKVYGTGSFGFYANDRIVVEINGKPCKVGISSILTLVKSKEADRK